MHVSPNDNLSLFPTDSEYAPHVDPPYIDLDPDIAAVIETDLHDGWKNPWRFDDTRIIRRQGNAHDRGSITRPAFARDIEKIMNLPLYNRYTDKTQVFSFQKNDDLSRRALHVQLVSRISRNIGRILGLNTDLIEAIALGHDIGHTPFGHAGERFLDRLYSEHTGRHFAHNVHSVRVLDALFDRNISLQTLDGVLCHNGEFAQRVLKTSDVSTFQQFDAEVEECYAEGGKAISRLRPQTLEACVVRICDMVAYLGKDRQDAWEAHVTEGVTFHSDFIGTRNAQIINNLTVDIVNNSYRKDHIELSEPAFADLKRAKDENYRYIYDREGVSADKNSDVFPMFSDVYEKLLDDLTGNDASSPIFRHHVALVCGKSRDITPEIYLANEPNQIVVDYMASMTDDYLIDLHSFLFPNSSRHIRFKGYFDSFQPGGRFQPANRL